MLKNKKIICGFISNLILLVVALFVPKSSLIVLTLCLWIDLVLYCLCRPAKRIYFLIFLISFFVFLMGRELLDVFGFHTIISPFSDATNRFAESLLLISLISLGAGFVSADYIRIKKKQEKSIIIDRESRAYSSTRQASLYLFYCTFVFSALELIDVGQFMIRYGYFATYTSFHSSLPYIFLKIADMTPIAFWVFLATMPKKKETVKNSIIFVIYLCLTLLTGKRFVFAAGLLILIAYFVMRHTTRSEGEEPWVKKSTIIIAIVAVPVLAIFLFVFGKIRFGLSVSGISSGNAIVDFFYGQGVSINVIKYSSVHEFSPEKKYMFSSTMTFLQKNFISRIIGIKSYSGNTVENALHGNSLAHALSYYLYGDRYLNGKGTGSCYIAEAYHDFKYFGVFVINYIYGFVLNRFFNFEKKGIYMGVISFVVLNSLLHAPRGSADGFVADIVDFTVWGTILCIYLFAKFIDKKRIQKEIESEVIEND